MGRRNRCRKARVGRRHGRARLGGRRGGGFPGELGVAGVGEGLDPPDAPAGFRRPALAGALTAADAAWEGAWCRRQPDDPALGAALDALADAARADGATAVDLIKVFRALGRHDATGSSARAWKPGQQAAVTRLIRRYYVGE